MIVALRAPESIPGQLFASLHDLDFGSDPEISQGWRETKKSLFAGLFFSQVSLYPVIRTSQGCASGTTNKDWPASNA